MKKMHSASAEWSREFQEFTSAPEMIPPPIFTERIMDQIRKDLNPAAWRVFAKVGFLHVFAGSLSLMLCPQFGMNPMHHGGLMMVFMSMGPYPCMFACGAFFVGISALLAGLILRPEEVRVVRRTRVVQFGILSLLSIGVFLCMGAEIIGSLALAWVLGSVIGGLATLELGWVVRRWLNKRRGLVASY